jgi:hypothetical protein
MGLVFSCTVACLHSLLIFFFSLLFFVCTHSMMCAAVLCLYLFIISKKFPMLTCNGSGSRPLSSDASVLHFAVRLQTIVLLHRSLLKFMYFSKMLLSFGGQHFIFYFCLYVFYFYFLASWGCLKRVLICIDHLMLLYRLSCYLVVCNISTCCV